MQFYKQSGRCGPTGVPLAFAAGVLAGLICGLIYAYTVNWIPFIYLSFIATLFFGGAVGAAVVWGARIGKIRNTPLISALGALVGLIAVYFAWVFDPMARFSEISQPSWSIELLWNYMKFGYAEGFWSIGQQGMAVSGMFLATVWILEAVVIVGVAFITVKTLHADIPFCEETNQWTTREKDVARLSLVDDEKVEAKLNRFLAGDLDSLKDFYRAAPNDGASLQLDLATCPDCPTCNYLTAKLIRHVTDKKGQVTTQEDNLLVNLQVVPENIERIRNAGIERPAVAANAVAQESAESDGAQNG